VCNGQLTLEIRIRLRFVGVRSQPVAEDQAFPQPMPRRREVNVMSARAHQPRSAHKKHVLAVPPVIPLRRVEERQRLTLRGSERRHFDEHVDHGLGRDPGDRGAAVVLEAQRELRPQPLAQPGRELRVLLGPGRIRVEQLDAVILSALAVWPKVGVRRQVLDRAAIDPELTDDMT
jgi:hypothetical protein